MIHRNLDEVSFVDEYLIEKGYTVDDDNRCQYLMGDDGIVDQALWAQLQSFLRNDTKHLLMVEYDDISVKDMETQMLSPLRSPSLSSIFSVRVSPKYLFKVCCINCLFASSFFL